MEKILLVGIFLLFLTGCANEEAAQKALYDARFHDIEITGYTFFGCSPADIIHTKFKAKNAFGKNVAGVVCSSPFSDKTQIKQIELD